MDNNTQKLLDEYYQKITMFAILCSKSSKYYSFRKNLLIIPNILITAILTIINSLFTDTNDIKIANIILSACSTLLIALDKSFQFSEKSSLFHKTSINFTTLSHMIDKFYIQPDTVNINELINSYDNIIENITYEIPSSIIDIVINQFDDDVKIPLIMLTSNNATKKQLKKNKIGASVNSVMIR
tara:strand:- start:9265 stop:9816 length:552 start_codon:yes stop_codon:yes gene_type:complete